MPASIDTLNDFEPSALCVSVFDPDAIVVAPLPYILILVLDEYTVEPSMTTLKLPAIHHSFDFLPYDFNVQLILLWFFATSCVADHVNLMPTESYVLDDTEPLNANGKDGKLANDISYALLKSKELKMPVDFPKK